MSYDVYPPTNPTGHPVAGAYVPEPETAAKVEAIAGRLNTIVQQRKELEEEEKFLRRRLSTLLPHGTTRAGEYSVQVRENRRFDANKAVHILSPDELRACTVEIVSAARARDVLPPARYAECQAASGDPVVRVS